MTHPKFQFQLFLLLIITKISTCDVRKIKCTMYDGNQKCTLSALTLTSKNYTFMPVALDANAVIRFEIVQSIIPVLTSNICTTLTKIKYFVAVEQGIERVEDYAFNNCTDAMEINLEKNNIHKLGVGIFSNTKQLKKLHILGGLFDHIDIDLFSNLGELIQLQFSANGLKDLPVEAMKNLKKLERLFIYSNNLVDLDAKGLVDNLPRLKSIWLNDNNFHCDHLIEIIDIFKARSVSIDDFIYTNTTKRRDYIPRTVKNIMCLTQAQLETEKLKRALTGSLNLLKDFPIGKEVIKLNELMNYGFEDSDSEILRLTTNLNELSNNLNGQITNLNVTLQKNLLENTDSVNELKNHVKTIQNKLDQNINDNSALQRQLEQKLRDNVAAQQQLEEKLSNNSATLQRLEQKLKDTVDSYRKHDETIASLIEKFKLLDASLNESKNGNTNPTYRSFGNYVISVWGCIIVLIVVDVIMLSIGWCFIRKFRKFSAHASIFSRDELTQQSSQHLLQESFT